MYSNGTRVGTEWHSSNIGTPITLGSFGSISAPSDGSITLLNNAGTSFVALQFGGTSAGFPALRNGGTTLDVKTADNSAFTRLRASNLSSLAAPVAVGAGAVCYGGTVGTTVGAAGAASALPATPTGYIDVFVAGVAQKIPYYN